MKKLVLIAFITLCISSIEAQTVIVYNCDTTAQSRTKSKVHMNAVSWNYSLLGRGSLAFEYDRKINDYLQIMAGAGLTIINPWYSYKYFVMDYNRYELKSVMPGLLLEIAPKVFPVRLDYLDGFYISPMYRYKTYNMILKNIFVLQDPEQEFKHSTSSHNLALVFGVQYDRGYFDPFWSFYIGAGYSFGKEKFQGQTSNMNPLLILLGGRIGFSW